MGILVDTVALVLEENPVDDPRLFDECAEANPGSARRCMFEAVLAGRLGVVDDVVGVIEETDHLLRLSLVLRHRVVLAQALVLPARLGVLLALLALQATALAGIDTCLGDPARTIQGVRSKSLDTWAIVRSLVRQRATTSARNSSVMSRRARRAPFSFVVMMDIFFGAERPMVDVIGQTVPTPTVRSRNKVRKDPGSRAAGPAMAFKLIEATEERWRYINGAHLVALVRAGAKFRNGVLVESGLREGEGAA